MDKKKYYQIRYEMAFNEGVSKEFNLELDLSDITLVMDHTLDPPPWTRLDHSQCECCQLEVGANEYCPIAVNISQLVQEFKDVPSFADVEARCVTPDRTYFKKTSVQDCLYSIFGIIMATSNCPTMNFLKPMARFHLPFSTIEETLVRSASLYLLHEYFQYRRGGKPDLDLSRLEENYDRVEVINNGIISRLRLVNRSDASPNAIVILNSLSQILNMAIDKDLYSIEYLFTHN